MQIREVLKSGVRIFKTKNFLNYPNYEEKIAEVQEKTHLEEAIKIGEAD